MEQEAKGEEVAEEDEVDAIVKDELDELLGLQVQFGETWSTPLECPREGRCITRTQVGQPSQQHIVIDDTSYKMWSKLGLFMGFTSDTEIATFLLRHYEGAESVSLPDSRCVVCQRALSLCCLHCHQRSPPGLLCDQRPSTSLHCATRRSRQTSSPAASSLPSRKAVKTRPKAQNAALSSQVSDTKPQNAALRKAVKTRPRALQAKAQIAALSPQVSNTKPQNATLSSKIGNARPQNAALSSEVSNSKHQNAALSSGVSSVAPKVAFGVSDVASSATKGSRTALKTRPTAFQSKPQNSTLSASGVGEVASLKPKGKQKVGRPTKRKVEEEVVLQSPSVGAVIDNREDSEDAEYDGDEGDCFPAVEEEEVGCEEETSGEQIQQVKRESSEGETADQEEEMEEENDEKVEEVDGMFSCKVCSHTYTRACSLKAHMRKHTGEKPFQCTHCAAAFSLSGSLIVHLRTHTGDKPYVCEDCGRCFAISSALKQHRRQHTGEKPYQCQICFSRYSRSDSLKVHMRSHSGERPFICEECGADFRRLYCLLAHKKKHSGQRPFHCNKCPATFTQSGKLTIHMRKHTGDRPFQCDQCGSSFTQSDRLKIHMRIHSGEKPYKCQQCGKGFSHPHSLKVHCRAHTGDRPYRCDICSLTFADPSYFRRHKSKHSAASSSSVVVSSASAAAVVDFCAPSMDPGLLPMPGGGFCSVPVSSLPPGAEFSSIPMSSSAKGYSVPLVVESGGRMSLPLNALSDEVSPAKGYSVHVESNECMSFQANSLPAATAVSSVAAAFLDHVHSSASSSVMRATAVSSQECFSSAKSSQFSLPLVPNVSVPSLGFSVPTSTSPSPSPVAFCLPAPAADDAEDDMGGVNTADAFLFLRSALHCPGSYNSA